MSRKLSDLSPDFRELVEACLKECQAREVEILIYNTLRSHEEQARNFRKGRTLSQIEAKAYILEHEFGRKDLADILMGVAPQYGEIVTQAAPGQSLHEYGYAADGVVVVDGKLIWDTTHYLNRELWERFGEAAEAVGLEWGGRWIRPRDFTHVQMPGVNWKDLIRQV